MDLGASATNRLQLEKSMGDSRSDAVSCVPGNGRVSGTNYLQNCSHTVDTHEGISSHNAFQIYIYASPASKLKKKLWEELIA
jgi:hypothetical protein